MPNFFEFLLKLFYVQNVLGSCELKKTNGRFNMEGSYTKCTCIKMSEESKCFGKGSTSRFRSNSSNFRNCWFFYLKKFTSFCSHLDQDNPKTLHCLAGEQSQTVRRCQKTHLACSFRKMTMTIHGFCGRPQPLSNLVFLMSQSVGGRFHVNRHNQSLC